MIQHCLGVALLCTACLASLSPLMNGATSVPASLTPAYPFSLPTNERTSRADTMRRTLDGLLSSPEGSAYGNGLHLRMESLISDPQRPLWTISRHQQLSADGIPVMGAELTVVWNEHNQIVSVTGTTVPDAVGEFLPKSRSTLVDPADAAAAASAGTSKDCDAVSARLVVFRDGMAKGVPGSNRLAWEVKCTGSTVYMDAATKKLLGEHRRGGGLIGDVYVSNGTFPLPLIWRRGQKIPDNDAELKEFVKTIEFMDKLWMNMARRNSFDGKGGNVTGFLRYNMGDGPYFTPDPIPSIYIQPGWMAPTVVWHEYGHAITDNVDKLWYEAESGALNEGWSDIVSMAIDALTNPHSSPRVPDHCTGNVTTSQRWIVANDCRVAMCDMKNADGHVVPSLRDMWAPRCINHTSGAAYPSQVPDMMCEDKDNMGVHFNSLIPGRLFAVFSDGYGTAVNGVGVERALGVFIRAKFLSVGPTTFKMYAQNLRTACSQLVGAEVNDHNGKKMPAMASSVCTELEHALHLVGIDSDVPCFAKPAVVLTNPEPYRVLVHRNSGSMLTVTGRGNFSGFYLKVNGTTGAMCADHRGQHPWAQFNDSNPVWTWTIRCPVLNPVTHGYPEPGYGWVTLFHDSNTSREYNVLWAPIPTLTSMEYSGTPGNQYLHFNGTNLWLNMTVVMTIGLDMGDMFYYGALCPTPQDAPSEANGCIMYKEGSSTSDTAAGFYIPEQSPRVPRNRYHSYISQHKGFYWSNSVTLEVKNLTSEVRLCARSASDHKAVPGASIRLSEGLFAEITATTGSDGCVAVVVEQEVDYRLAAEASGLHQVSSAFRIDNTTVSVDVDMEMAVTASSSAHVVSSAGSRASGSTVHPASASASSSSHRALKSSEAASSSSCSFVSAVVAAAALASQIAFSHL
eukprot:m51a1_g4034 hypothetical protein (907) ;mRNA; r:658493-661608